jgi:hypothetical protein
LRNGRPFILDDEKISIVRQIGSGADHDGAPILGTR